MAAVFEQVDLQVGMQGWENPELKATGIVNVIGEVHPGADGRQQWDAGVRCNFVADNYTEEQRPVVEAINAHGHAMMAEWAGAAGLAAVARPLRSTSTKGEAVIPDSAYVSGREFELGERTANGLVVATTKDPTDFVMIRRDDAPEGAGVMYSVADSATVTLGDEEGKTVGIIHGLRDAVIGGIGGKAVGFMCDRAGVRPEKLIAVIGPGVQACCDEVGVQKPGTQPREGGTVQRAMAAMGETGMNNGYLPKNALVERVAPDGTITYHFDSQAALRYQLTRAGVGHVVTTAECTAQTTDKGGHFSDNPRRFPSLRGADALAAAGKPNVMVAPDGTEIELSREHRVDWVSRYPVLAGFALLA